MIKSAKYFKSFVNKKTKNLLRNHMTIQLEFEYIWQLLYIK